MRFNSHSVLVDNLYSRLRSNNRKSRVTKETPYYNSRGRLAGVIDVKVMSKKNDVYYIDYWEVKSSNSHGCRNKAYRQARHFYDAFSSEDLVKPRFVLVTPKGVTRISEYQAFKRGNL